MPEALVCSVTLYQFKFEHFDTFKTGTIELSIGNKKIQAYGATGDICSSNTEPDTGESLRLFVHLPIFGTPVEVRYFSVLPYIESQSLAVVEAKEENIGKILAPMPCKVLQVLKREGAQVKTGEPVMIIESMKMEIAIYANKAGKFNTSVQTGDAVDEGIELCAFA